MIKALITDSRRGLEVHGSTVDVLADLTVLIGMIYHGTKRSNVQAAELFHRTLIAALTDPASPAWTVDPTAGVPGLTAVIPYHAKEDDPS